MEKIKIPLKQVYNFLSRFYYKWVMGCKGKVLFDRIEIETQNWCNGTCIFCPVNSKIDPRNHIQMNEELFYKIIDELRDINYDKDILLFSNNEPLLDNRIIGLIKYARGVKRARLVIFSNGELLNVVLVDILMKYLDLLVINDYSNGKNSHILWIKNWLKKNNFYNGRVKLRHRKSNEVLTTRGGKAPNKKPLPSPYFFCLAPFRQLVIRSSGEVSQCCNDALGTETLGDVNDNTLQEIWHNCSYRYLRETILLLGRKALPLCRNCDTFIGGFGK